MDFDTFLNFKLPESDKHPGKWAKVMIEKKKIPLMVLSNQTNIPISLLSKFLSGETLLEDYQLKKMCDILGLQYSILQSMSKQIEG